MSKQEESKIILDDSIAKGIIPPYLSQTRLEETESLLFVWGDSLEENISFFINREGECYWAKPSDFSYSERENVKKCIQGLKKNLQTSTKIKENLRKTLSTFFNANPIKGSSSSLPTMKDVFMEGPILRSA